jgi:hypothetical protein
MMSLPASAKASRYRIDRRNHQVNVDHLLRVRAQRLHHGRADGDVGHEMPVHHIDMHPVRPAASMARTSSPRRAKSAERMEGEMRTGRFMNASPYPRARCGATGQGGLSTEISPQKMHGSCTDMRHLGCKICNRLFFGQKK